LIGDLQMGLFERWLEIERATGRPMVSILADINAACGTSYRHNWPSLMAKRGYSMDRCPTNVRRYMMGVVLPTEIEQLGIHPTEKVLALMVARLT
jgi:hypothetical protein